MASITRKSITDIMPSVHQQKLDADPKNGSQFARNTRVTPSWLLEGQPARIYFTVALIAFTAAAAGWVISSFLTGWMQTAGMLALGLFYLGLGLLEAGRRTNS